MTWWHSRVAKEIASSLALNLIGCMFQKIPGNIEERSQFAYSPQIQKGLLLGVYLASSIDRGPAPSGSTSTPKATLGGDVRHYHLMKSTHGLLVVCLFVRSFL